jgi:signal peptidase I
MEKTHPTAKAQATATATSTARTIRETVESIAIAFVLAFLFRTFEAEAFVIPTGSMAPTLQGRHKDITCPECGFQFRVGAQGEREERNPNLRMVAAACPMCRYELNMDELIGEDPREFQTFEGDRILVNKFSYDLAEPKRWDVVVFKYPEDAKTNYIKRLVGLPGERVIIGDPGRDMPPGGTGDIYISTDGGKTRQIARKQSPEKLLAVLQDVHDNDYIPKELINAGWPPRWQNSPDSSTAWTAEDDTRAFEVKSEAGQAHWLRYHHLVPRSRDGTWTVAADADYAFDVVRDFYAYNTGAYPRHHVGHGENWVGDLALEAEVEARSAAGELIFELVKGGRTFQAIIDLAGGKAELRIPGLDAYHPAASNVVDGAGTYQIRFVNVDQQLWLFINDKLIEFDAPTTYDMLGNYMPVTDARRSALGATDLSPAGIASVGADVRVGHLRVKRDIFYGRAEQLGAISEIQLLDSDDNDKDQFFMLGDNSPASKDGRMWGPVDYVERRLLIGKAIYIYWPHGIPASFSFPVNVVGSDKYIPFWPNFGRMHRVR